ncbi:hypothetical protein V5N34_35010 [Streptomyces baarnensis]|uniref:hypothetical protein n=1 Tax=Streptomyces TaxID=1883 RepID=UPI0029BD819C|nr:hypothetical protein [Streptomyces sp. ME02-6979.5a]MDX3342699.1 hypothetical protein [Streptomyces sp. ME02-6979.5a]
MPDAPPHGCAPTTTPRSAGKSLAVDALLCQLGASGIAQLHSDLDHGAPINYPYTRCPYCSGLGEGPTLLNCRELSCPLQYEFADHPHVCTSARLSR